MGGSFGENDTIAAISTAMNEAGIGIVRISGPRAVEAADALFRAAKAGLRLKDVPTHTIHYGWVVEKDENIRIDEVLVSVMRAPRTFTAEDTVEINCHGGIYPMKRVLARVLREGVRLARPGEFTSRAFLNGRIDLSEAEAVMDVIRSRSDLALENGIRQIGGALTRKVLPLRGKLLETLAQIEAQLDDPENPETARLGEREQTAATVQEALAQIGDLLRSAREGRFVREGVRCAIIGKPNAGKSSLLNRLTGEDRAIVTEYAGTTRDVLTESVTLGGVCLLLTDTAGIRQTDDPVEKIGVERARAAVADADLLLCVIDAAQEPDEDDMEILSLTQGHRALILLNKNDLSTVVDETGLREKMAQCGIETEAEVLTFSAKEGDGLEELTRRVQDMFFAGTIHTNAEVLVTNERHAECLRRAADSLRSVEESLANGMAEDFLCIDLREAVTALGEITGEETGEDLVNEIFSKFCMGK